MSKFEVGDRVRVTVYDDDPTHPRNGKTGTVTTLTSRGNPRVKIDGTTNTSSGWIFYDKELEAIEVNNDYDKAIEDMETQLAELKAKREAEKLPDEPDYYGAVIRQKYKVPAFRDAFVRKGDAAWHYVTSPDSPAITWKELLSREAEFEILYDGVDD